MKPSSQPIDFTNYFIDYAHNSVTDSFFYEYVSPYLDSFFDSLSINYASSETTQKLIFESLGERIERGTLIKIRLKDEQYFVYSILPCHAPSLPIPDKHFYNDRCGKQVLCDYEIMSAGGRRFPVHKNVLYFHGGPFFVS